MMQMVDCICHSPQDSVPPVTLEGERKNAFFMGYDALFPSSGLLQINVIKQIAQHIWQIHPKMYGVSVIYFSLSFP